MTDAERDKINTEYEEYRKNDKHYLPFIIWLTHKKKIKKEDYYED